MTHLPSEATADCASLQERRARLEPWVRFADEAYIAAGVYEGTRLCTVCSRMIGEGELDFLVVLARAVALRVDRECLDLWHESVTNGRHRASTDLGREWPSADEDHAFPPDLRPMVAIYPGL